MGYEGSPEGAQRYSQRRDLHGALSDTRLAIEVAIRSKDPQIQDLINQLIVATKLIHTDEIDARREHIKDQIQLLK